MTTEASKSDSLTAALTQLSHDLEALPGKIAAEVAAQVAAALKPKAPFMQIRVGGVEIPFLELSIIRQGGTLIDGRELGDEAYFIAASKHADLLQINKTVKIIEGDPAMGTFTGWLLDRTLEGDTIVCHASSVTADGLFIAN